MTLLRLPEPYDFELSTERFRAFGPDLANLWHEGGVHRVVNGREFRIEAARERAKEMAVFALIVLASAWPVIYMLVTVVKLLSTGRPLQ